ncbi:MAG: response regulator transcription factor [Actinomycetota bacterium]
MTRVLVVDDEPQIRRALRTSLQANSYEVVTASNGMEALEKLAEASPDIVFLDLGLPDLDGAEVIRRLRGFSEVPVIVVSVRESQADKVTALDAGADDYVTKPFAVPELLARLRAALRRADADQAAPQPILAFDGLEVDLGRKLVRRDGSAIHLTKTEYNLLESMVTNAGKLLSHTWLLDRVWGRGHSESSHYLRVYVRQLRKKLGDDAMAPRFITTEPGVGYRWIAEPGDL